VRLPFRHSNAGGEADLSQSPAPAAIGSGTSGATDSRPLPFLLFTACCAAGLLCWYLFMKAKYPFYFMWDMDQMTTVDLLLIHSGLLPDHINHTSFGMYLFLFLSQKIGRAVGCLSVLNLSDLGSCLNPLAAVAESADYLRLHSPLLSLGIALSLSVALRFLFRPPIHFWLVFFLIFGIQESLTYQSTMIRSELYSVFFWSCAVLTLSVPSRHKHGLLRCVRLVVAGLLLGLAFMTKVQSLVYVIAGALLTIPPLFAHTTEDERVLCPSTSAGRNAALAASWLTLTASIAIGIMAHRTAIPLGVLTWARAFGPTPLAIGFYSGLAAIAIGSAFTLRRRLPTWLCELTTSLTLLSFGFLLAFGLHFLLFRDPAVSWNYLLLDFKMLFLRSSELVESRGVSAALSELRLYLQYNPTTLLVHAALVVGTLVARRYGWLRLGRVELAVWLALSLFAVANIALGTRFLLRDTLWKETLVNFASLAWCAMLLTRCVRHCGRLRFICIALLGLLLLNNARHSLQIIDRTDANHNHYGWNIDRWFMGTYMGNNRKYSETMFRRYDNTTTLAARASVRDYGTIRRTVDFVLKNQRIDHRNIGLLSEGFSAWSADLDYRLVSVPQQLRGSILVDAARVPADRGLLFREEYVATEVEYLDKMKRPAGNRIALLTRSDLQILLFVRASEVPQLKSRLLVETPYRVFLKKRTETLELQALLVTNYVELPPERLGSQSFVVIHSTL
jgi:hypothetical protein